MNVRPTGLDGCFIVEPPVFSDERGSFVKSYHEATFAEHGIDTPWRELFWSRSARGVIRGLHFQLPPADQAKLVTCVSGQVFDVALDLRAGSDTFGEHAVVELTAEAGNALYVPKGMAHGFMALTEDAVVCYAVETVHDPSLDTGVRWDSCGIDWPALDQRTNTVSPRDQSFPPLSAFESPFRG